MVEKATLRRTKRAMCGAKLMSREKEARGPNGDVGIEGNSGSDGESELSEMHGTGMC